MYRIAFASLLMLLMTTCTLAQDAQRKTLKGIRSIEVVVADFKSDSENRGINKEQVQADVELSLRKAGIKVEKDSVGSLYISADIIRQTAQGVETGVLAYCISVEFDQPATLEANKSTVMVVTWSRGYHGLTPNNNFRKVRDQIDDMLNIFINDFLAENPK